MPNKQPSTYTLSPRRKRNHELMIQTILETAWAIMRQDSVLALSLQELSRRLDMHAPSFYHYFSSKMDFLRRTVPAWIYLIR